MQIYIRIFSIFTVTGQQCGANYFLESGILVSPNFQNPYSDGEYCVWTIRGDNDDIVTLTFIDLIIGHDLDCNVDYVEVKINRPHHAKMCLRVYVVGEVQDQPAHP